MKPNQLLTFILAILLYNSLIAQGIIKKESDITPSNFSSHSQQLNYYSQQSNDVVSNANINVVNKGVYIVQVGNNNNTNVSAQSQVSDIELKQYGHSNIIDLNLKAEFIDYTALQQGNNNLLLEYNLFDNKQLIERNIQQKGNNQNLVIHGRNSIADKMKITMNEGSQSLIIRNTN